MKQKTFYDGDFNVKKLDLDKIIKFYKLNNRRNICFHSFYEKDIYT